MKESAVDIETLGAEPCGAAITAVAIVTYDVNAPIGEIIDSAVWFLDPKLTPGRRDQDTLRFWGDQDPALFARVMGGDMTPWAFCQAFSEYCSMDGEQLFWAYPTRFDFGHLRELYHACGHEFPFKFWRERDLTTYRHVAREVAEAANAMTARTDMALARSYVDRLERGMKAIKDANAAAHDPLQDCVTQAKLRQYLYRFVTTAGRDS